jgi:soluble lytic murein transglycosylase-like protein
MNPIHPPGVLFIALLGCALAGPLSARTVYRCVLDGSVSLATAPEPGSICTAQELDDNAALLPNLWGDQRARHGALYRRVQDGKTVYSTRELPGSVALFNYTVVPPAGSPVHPGMGEVGTPRLDAWPQLFRNAARRHKVDDALLRAVAHAESGFDALAVSPKGAQGVMQLMPATARDYAVVDPFSPAESISAGARHLGGLLRLYGGDRNLATAAYNAGQGAVARYGGVPPYAETQRYVAKVEALYQLYTSAM